MRQNRAYRSSSSGLLPDQRITENDDSLIPDRRNGMRKGWYGHIGQMEGDKGIGWIGTTERMITAPEWRRNSICIITYQKAFIGKKKPRRLVQTRVFNIKKIGQLCVDHASFHLLSQSAILLTSRWGSKGRFFLYKDSLWSLSICSKFVQKDIDRRPIFGIFIVYFPN